MGFIMDGLDAEAYDRTYSDGQLIRRIIQYFRPKVPLMITITILVVLSACLDTAFPILISNSLDTLGGSQALQTAIWLVAFILITGVLSWFSNLFRQSFTARAVGNVVLKLRSDAFNSVMSRDMSFFEQILLG